MNCGRKFVEEREKRRIFVTHRQSNTPLTTRCGLANACIAPLKGGMECREACRIKIITP